jgi:hypothetical protein
LIVNFNNIVYLSQIPYITSKATYFIQKASLLSSSLSCNWVTIPQSIALINLSLSLPMVL